MRYIYTLILFIFPFLNQAQGLKPQVPLTYEIQYPSGNKAVKSCANSISPTTAFMLLDYHRFMVGDIPQTEFVAKYGIVIKERTLYINAFIHLNNAESINALISKGVLTRINKGNIITGLIPLNKFEEVLQNNGVRYIDIGNKVESNLDSSKIYSRTDSVHAGYAPLSQSYKGNGVIVGVIDIGFDYTHPNFYDSSGTGGYRIKRVWEQRKTGTPPSGFSYGRELTTQSDILNAKTDLTDQTHGSHVAGISAGAGVNNFNMIGAAPMADIVLVATTMYTTDIADGIEYIEKYAASVGKPCVINMSLGSIFGNHDGTGSFSQLCDNSFVKESNILVVAAGNDGRTSNKVHVNREIKGVSASDSDFYSFISFPGSGIKVNGSTYVDIWGEVGDTFFVGIGVYNKVANSYESFSPFLYGAHIDTFTSITLYDNNPTPIPCYIDIYQGVSSDNSRPRITFAIDNRYQTSANRQLLLYVKSLKKSTINMWTANASAHFVSNGYSNTEDGDSYMTINELATGEKIISVGAYTSKDFWYPYAYPSTSYSYGGNSARGEAAPFTSMGPTLDGRVKPDISAPGTAIVSSYNSYIANASYTNSTTSTIITNMITFGAKSWYYGVMQGTSMATPFATGVIALWLEMYPQLNYKQIKSIFLETALRDSFTGTIPFAGNNVWGQGKINAFVGIVPEKASINPKDTISICPNELNVKLSVNESFEKYEWNTGDSLSFILASNVGWYRVRGINKFGIPGPWSDSVYVIKSDLALNLGNDTIFCHNTFIHLDAKNIGSTYTWSDGSANQTFTANQTGKYWVNVYKDRCMISDTIQITESDLELDLGNDTIFCHNTFIHLDAKNIGSTYAWSDGSANQTFTANQTGKYWVNVYKDRCMISDSIQITESDLELDLGNDTIFCHNTFIHLDAKNIGSTYAWSDGSANQTF
ncbi:MAG: S8 family serine peptidase, partial [Bacteroidetes bacterium]|nr:S8 family serine peptidase [Bacteroidota bacterium]